VEGSYQTSFREDGWTFFWIVLLMFPGGVVAGKAWVDFQRTSREDDLLLALFGCVMMAAVALWLMPRIGVKYEFRDGHIAKLARRGKVAWRESLSTVPRVILCCDRLNTFITLRWSERRRSFLVPDSLASAIDAAQATSNTSLERTRGR
jgi:hypothetical protein